MLVLIHTSKVMRSAPAGGRALTEPALRGRAEDLAAYLKTLSVEQLATVMEISPALAARTHALLAEWGVEPGRQSPAMDSFAGDIYSGLRACDFSEADRAYADERLRILSGLYGIVRPHDAVQPYRLEMGYRLPDPPYTSLYAFWGTRIAESLPPTEVVVNLAAAEYHKTITAILHRDRFVTPRFLTVHPKTNEPRFVVVHAKIARGAFARWLLTARVEDPAAITDFAEIGYRYEPGLSRPRQPVFVCKEFEGKGLSVRLHEPA
ncbi:YaaA family protein [Micromonospora sp. 15K316]|uniref:YaaA family protein n=1 Tax=Micromonospora sp. 15K316 TaxID=2530376 RepID=UPI001051E2A0|nr:YaaA family protein [Micromonospora sp. 15K316]TDC37413.1 YaaA family protein [Micromonospora sp. 15K316]